MLCLFSSSGTLVCVICSCSFQPLMDNLDSQTYDIFEKDPTKYTQYEKVQSTSQYWSMSRDISAIIVKQLVSYFFTGYKCDYCKNKSVVSYFFALFAKMQLVAVVIFPWAAFWQIGWRSNLPHFYFYHNKGESLELLGWFVGRYIRLTYSCRKDCTLAICVCWLPSPVYLTPVHSAQVFQHYTTTMM